LTTAIDTSDIRPRYPLGARLRGEEGWVLLAIRVGRNGRADAVTIAESSGFHALDQAALQAALQAAYIGADGRTRAGETEVSVRFRLED
jgi:protein TonB